MMLVEIIIGKKTGDAALARALDFVRAIRKTPIVVNDTPRLLHLARRRAPTSARATCMLTEGVPAAMIENAGADGRHAGRAAVAERRGGDRPVAEDHERDRAPTSATTPCRRPQYRLIDEMVTKRGRLGRKNGKGFYDYPDNPRGKKKLWPGLAELFPPVADPDAIDVGELKQRFLVIQALETARCFDEGVSPTSREADVGSILGFGFAPFTGGTLSYIDFMGVAEFVKLCERLAKKHGPRFKPNRLLRDMAKKRRDLLRPLRRRRPARRPPEPGITSAWR